MGTKIEFSRHAKRRMKWRDVSEADVRDAIVGPDHAEHDALTGRKTVIKATKSGTIKVVYAEKEDRLLVVTALRKGRMT